MQNCAIALLMFFLLLAFVAATMLATNAYVAFNLGQPFIQTGLSFFTQPHRFDSYLRERRTSGESEKLRSLEELAGNTHRSYIERFLSPFHRNILPTDKNAIREHNYLQLYERLFGPLRAKNNLKMLEIGVYRGGSMVLWREYFHQDAHIFGVDIVQTSPRFPAEHNIHIQIADSTTPGAAGVFDGEVFDVIIDDGNHWEVSQIATAANFFGRLASPGGIYVIEDADPHQKSLSIALHKEFPGTTWTTFGNNVYCIKK